MVGDRFAGSMKGFVLLSGPKGFAARFEPWPEPPNGELEAFDLSLPAYHATLIYMVVSGPLMWQHWSGNPLANLRQTI